MVKLRSDERSTCPHSSAVQSAAPSFQGKVKRRTPNLLNVRAFSLTFSSLATSTLVKRYYHVAGLPKPAAHDEAFFLTVSMLEVSSTSGSNCTNTSRLLGLLCNLGLNCERMTDIKCKASANHAGVRRLQATYKCKPLEGCLWRQSYQCGAWQQIISNTRASESVDAGVR